MTTYEHAVTIMAISERTPRAPDASGRWKLVSVVPFHTRGESGLTDAVLLFWERAREPWEASAST